MCLTLNTARYTMGTHHTYMLLKQHTAFRHDMRGDAYGLTRHTTARWSTHVNVLIYAGPAPSREHVIQFSTPIAQHVATSLTLVIGGAGQQALLTATAAQLNPPPGVSVELRALPGNAQVAVLTAAREQTYDLVILG